MKLYIAGGVGEHGRNCFLVNGESINFLVDFGKMADTLLDPYPRLTKEQITSLDAVFLTHSHADHTGALPWLYENGFKGTVIASVDTLRQLPFNVEKHRTLSEICPHGTGKFNSLGIEYGRSGHCAGSVWLQLSEGEKTIFFSGDYTEDTQVYSCDVIRNRKADLAVLDCAYGKDDAAYSEYCEKLVSETEKQLSERSILLFPVPKYGRGIEIFKLFSDNLSGVKYYADELFMKNLTELNSGGFWYKDEKITSSVGQYSGEKDGIVFVSDPQLRSSAAQVIAEQVLSLGGRAVMTGTLEKGSFSEMLFSQGKADMLRYPVHLGYAQFRRLNEQNEFGRTVPYHSKDFTSERTIEF